MGWNQGYSQYEETVIELYNTGKLDKDALEIVLKPYKGTDMDHGGCADLQSNDGLSADEIVVKILAPEFWGDYQNKMQDFYARCGVTTWKEWADKNYKIGMPEWEEDWELSSSFSQKWAELTETW